MKTSKQIMTASITIITMFLLLARGFSQGTFQNLNFEAANLPAIPSGQFGSLVATSVATPSWTAHYGTALTAQILHNNYSLGAVNISIFGPNWDSFPILQGSYSLLLQSGLGTPNTPTPAAIAQTGTIPATALSVRFLARQLLGSPSARLDVSIGGQSASLVPLSITANYTLYGADVSAYSGTTSELRIGSLPNAGPQYGSFLIDSIEFSSQPVPEPSTLGLFGLGALLFSYRSRLVTKT